jgi:phage gp29-like protein
MIGKSTSWRDFYNPLKNLTISRIVAMEDQALRGQHADLQWFYEFMHHSDVMIQAAMARRLAYLDALDWEIKIMESADPVLGQEQAALLRYAYDKIKNLREATHELAKSLFFGFSHLEKEFSGYANLVSRLVPIPRWNWVQQRPSGQWRFNQRADPVCDPGEFVPRDTLVIAENTPLFRAISRHFFAKTLAMADWDIALDTSANQSIFFVAPPGTDTAGMQVFADKANELASNGRGALPNGSTVESVDPAGDRSKMPYKERIDYSDREIVTAATGGILTMLTESGSGTLAGGAHEEGLLSLARSDGTAISEIFQRDLDLPWLATFFPRQPKVAYFCFNVPQKKPTPLDVATLASNLSWSGYKFEQKWLEEQMGAKLEVIEQPAQ